jgi:putative DNA primase/helicase
VVSLASDDRRMAATAEQWDADPWLLCTPGGTVNLRTGKLREAQRADYMTMMTAATPGGDCPRWHDFLDVVTGKNTKLQEFLQVCCGYTLTGLTTEQVLLFLYGEGQNGKTVFINAIAKLMGDYYVTCPMEALIDSKMERHPTDLAGLRGKRMVAAAETEKGRHWNESRIKSMTGGDPINARFMRQDFFEYSPQFTLWVYGNHKPGLKSVNKAIRRRLKLIPFTVTIRDEQRDPDLPEKLKAEWGGILAWMIKGCLIWQEKGLIVPKTVTDATEGYLGDEDAIARWIAACCEKDPQAETAFGDLFRSWSTWAEQMREYVGSSKNFSAELERRGFESQHGRKGAMVRGLRLMTGSFALDEEPLQRQQ